MDYSTVFFLDASVLVKLVVSEAGSDKLTQLLDLHEPLYATLLCFAEALGVLKRKCFFEKPGISQEQYIRATHLLCAYFKAGVLRFEEASLSEPRIFFAAAALSDRYGIDLSDALQIVTVRESMNVDATLITTDEALAEAASKERVMVWNCLREPMPTV